MVGDRKQGRRTAAAPVTPIDRSMANMKTSEPWPAAARAFFIRRYRCPEGEGEEGKGSRKAGEARTEKRERLAGLA